MKISDVQWNSEQYFIRLDTGKIAFTAAEYRLLYPLRHCRPVSYASLSRQAYNCTVNKTVRKMMDKHIEGIRARLRGTGIYLYCVLSYGYVLCNENPAEEERESS